MELKRCPFCGLIPMQLKQYELWFVRCGNCKTISGVALTKEQSAEAWNTRKGDEVYAALGGYNENQRV